MTNFNMHIPFGDNGNGVTFLQAYAPDLRILSDRIGTLKSKAFNDMHAPGSTEEDIHINLETMEKNGGNYTLTF